MFEIEETVANQAPIERVWSFVRCESNCVLCQMTLRGAAFLMGWTLAAS